MTRRNDDPAPYGMYFQSRLQERSLADAEAGKIKNAGHLAAVRVVRGANDRLLYEVWSSRNYDITSAIIAYENGELTEDAAIEMFQHLVDTGMAWKLQGSYGRAALALIQAGMVTQGAR